MSKPKQRIQWIDIARAMAMLLVFFKFSTRASYAEVQENGHSLAWNEFVKIWEENNRD
uniref:hypothetical protein n=1 Tax=Bifidobacterium adolescentis TaxID=1680 RepID=UPI00359C714A